MVPPPAATALALLMRAGVLPLQHRCKILTISGALLQVAVLPVMQPHVCTRHSSRIVRVSVEVQQLVVQASDPLRRCTELAKQ